MQKVWLRIVGLAGGVVFATFFALTFYVPSWVEDFAADFIEAEAGKQIDATIDGLEPPQGDSALTRLATTLYQQNQAEIERLKADLKLLVHEQMADLIAEIRDLSCECRDKYAEIFERGFQFEVALLQAANDQIVDFVQSAYMQVVDELKRDIRVFTGSNAGCFFFYWSSRT
jgi:hypothetical protein